MNKLIQAGLVLAAVIVVGLLAFGQLGLIDWTWPWERVDVMAVEVEVSQPEAATIITVEPIALDCRARISSLVPIEGRKEHSFAGQVYRTDTVKMTVVGDIDTCVESGEVEVVHRDDGSVRVIVPADAIRFERPRVDTVATLDSVVYDKGALGKLTDVFPWVSDDSGLTPAAYAYAQTIIGSTDCMSKAFDTTQRAVVKAYRDQLIAGGHDPSLVIVDIVGKPDFSTTAAPEEVLDGYDFTVDTAATSCTVAAGAFERGVVASRA